MNRTQPANEEVILVHGLWYGSWLFRRLAGHLHAAGFSTRRFEYRSTSGSLQQHAASLKQFVGGEHPVGRHYLGHSLGGLVILKMLDAMGDSSPGRVLLLGSPLQGSVTARKAAKIPGSDVLLGQVRDALEQGFDRLPENREIGMIAGSRGMGLGLLVGGVGSPGDGTVSLEETITNGLADRVVLPVTHSGMLVSGKVIRQSVRFLRTGRFDSR